MLWKQTSHVAHPEHILPVVVVHQPFWRAASWTTRRTGWLRCLPSMLSRSCAATRTWLVYKGSCCYQAASPIASYAQVGNELSPLLQTPQIWDMQPEAA